MIHLKLKKGQLEDKSNFIKIQLYSLIYSKYFTCVFSADELARLTHKESNSLVQNLETSINATIYESYNKKDKQEANIKLSNLLIESMTVLSTELPNYKAFLSEELFEWWDHYKHFMNKKEI